MDIFQEGEPLFYPLPCTNLHSIWDFFLQVIPSLSIAAPASLSGPRLPLRKILFLKNHPSPMASPHSVDTEPLERVVGHGGTYL
jgi:hypothetical protein